MDKYYQNKYRINSARKEGHDYSFTGYYFITINAMSACFGKKDGDKIALSKAGQVAEAMWREIPANFNNVKLDEFVVMPDHFHGLLLIERYQRRDAVGPVNGGITGRNNPMLSKNSVSKIIRWFKGRTAFEIRRSLIPSFGWQSRFYDSIVKEEEELEKVRAYIRNNPVNFK
jgi:putative transposase